MSLSEAFEAKEMASSTVHAVRHLETDVQMSKCISFLVLRTIVGANHFKQLLFNRKGRNADSES